MHVRRKHCRIFLQLWDDEIISKQVQKSHKGKQWEIGPIKNFNTAKDTTCKIVT